MRVWEGLPPFLVGLLVSLFLEAHELVSEVAAKGLLLLRTLVLLCLNLLVPVPALLLVALQLLPP